MQLTAARLQVRVMVSCVPIPPELPPAVPIVRPVRGMPAQVTIVITAAVLSRISEIIVKYVNTKYIQGLVCFFIWEWTDEQTCSPSFMIDDIGSDVDSL